VIVSPSRCVVVGAALNAMIVAATGDGEGAGGIAVAVGAGMGEAVAGRVGAGVADELVVTPGARGVVEAGRVACVVSV
jgi:hypothetical protein